MGRYRKKPVVIEAVQFRGDLSSGHEVWSWSDRNPAITVHDGHLIITTLEGDHRADPGDWIIRGVHGELYPCKPDIFEKTYEPVEE